MRLITGAISITSGMWSSIFLFLGASLSSQRTAQRIIDLAGLSSQITVITCRTWEYLPDILQHHPLAALQPADLVLFDYWTDPYLNDLQTLEHVGVVAKGTCIIADCVLFPGATSFKQYLLSSGAYKTDVLEADQQEYIDEVVVSVRVKWWSIRQPILLLIFYSFTCGCRWSGASCLRLDWSRSHRFAQHITAQI